MADSCLRLGCKTQFMEEYKPSHLPQKHEDTPPRSRAGDMVEGNRIHGLLRNRRSGIISPFDFLLAIICSETYRHHERNCVNFDIRFISPLDMRFGGTTLVFLSVIPRSEGKAALVH